MRHPSNFSLHRLTAAIMSTRPLFRGGRGRRSYSDRPLPVSVANNNIPFQRTAPTNNNNNNFNHSNNHNSGYSNTDYSRVNYNYNNNNNNVVAGGGRGRGGGSGGNFRLRAEAPPFNRPQGRIQRPKPADFRTWEYAKNRPPPNAERFVVLSYNILADYLAYGHRKLYFHIPRRFMSWEWRKSNILFELKLWSPDIMCLQEVDRFQELEEDLRARGYSGIWKMRTGEPVDGCAIFWQTTRFKLTYEECIEFNKHGMRDNVAQICVLESLMGNLNRERLPSSSSEGPNRVVICNIHVLYNPRRGEIKLGQIRMLLERAQAVSKTWDDAPIVLCGDFNCTPKSPLYNFIAEHKLDISEVERDKVSGQASAEIQPPPRQYNYLSREQPIGRVDSPTVNQNNSMDSKQTDSPQNQIPGESIVDNVRTAEQPLPDGSFLDVSKNLSDDSFKISSLSEEVKIKTFENVTDFPEKVGEEICPDVSVTMSAKPHDQLISEQNSSLSLSSEEVDEKLVGLSVNDMEETLEENEDTSKDAEEFLSALHDGEDVIPSDLGDVVLEGDTPDADKLSYDPSLWTAMEIATATGDANRTVLEHPLKLKSTYSEVDSSGTRDSYGEPLVTSYNSCFMGTVDYIWRSEGLQTVKVLAPIPKDVMQPSGGFPTKKWGSDHIALASELAFIK